MHSVPSTIDDFAPRKASSARYTPSPFLESFQAPPAASPLLSTSNLPAVDIFEKWLSDCTKNPLNNSYHNIIKSVDFRNDYFQNCQYLSHTHCNHVSQLKTALCCLCLTRPPLYSPFYATNEECIGNYIPGISCASNLINQ